MNDCAGAIILGFKQIVVQKCMEKQGTDRQNNDRKDFFLPTPWNQIEAGIAFVLNLPLLIIHEKGVEGGIFDAGVTDKFIHQIDLSVDSKHRQQADSQIQKYFESGMFLQPLSGTRRL